jgi:hypothetical protein
MIKKLLTATAILLAIAHTNARAATSVDLTGGGTTTLNAGQDIYSTVLQSPTGSGVIDSFVRISTNEDIVEGYNTDARPVQFDENTSPTFTRSLELSDVPIVTIDGVQYREFLLDINQTSADPLLSLNELQIFLGNAGDLSGATVDSTTGLLSFGGNANLVYDLDATTDYTVELNYDLNSGSGTGDLFVYIADSLFTGNNQFVYLYSSFGVPNNNNDGFEEWAVLGRPSVAAVPEPSTVVMALAGLLPLGIAGLRRRLRRTGEASA